MNKNYTYIFNALNQNKLCRWNKQLINVYIDYAELGSHLDKNKVESSIKASFAVWESALNGKLKFNFTKCFNEDCNIYIDFQRNNFMGTIGVCSFSKVLPNGEFKRMYITIGLIYSQFFEMTVIHEIGHALGIAGHSPHNLDIMYKSLNPTVTKLSQKDINTIRLIYELPLGCSYEYIKKNINSILNNTFKNKEPEAFNYNQSKQNNIAPLTCRDIAKETYEIGIINMLKYSQNNIELKPEICRYIEGTQR